MYKLGGNFLDLFGHISPLFGDSINPEVVSHAQNVNTLLTPARAGFDVAKEQSRVLNKRKEIEMLGRAMRNSTPIATTLLSETLANLVPQNLLQQTSQFDALTKPAQKFDVVDILSGENTDLNALTENLLGDINKDFITENNAKDNSMFDYDFDFTSLF